MLAGGSTQPPMDADPLDADSPMDADPPMDPDPLDADPRSCDVMHAGKPTPLSLCTVKHL